MFYCFEHVSKINILFIYYETKMIWKKEQETGINLVSLNSYLLLNRTTTKLGVAELIYV